MSNLRLCIQKGGRLSEKSLALLNQCGVAVANGGSLKAEARHYPMEVLFLRDDDIPQAVQDGVADAGILGENVALESGKDVEIVEKLGFGRCRLSLAVRREESYEDTTWFEGKRIATTYPRIVESYLKEKGVSAAIEKINGSVEIAPSIGLADGICDIVSTGSTLLSNGLKEVETIMRSESVLVKHKDLEPQKAKYLENLVFRIQSVLRASEFKYILLNAPNEALEGIMQELPGMNSPTILPLAKEGWSSLHSVIREDDFWERIGRLKDLGAEGILVCPIEKMIL
ncbi:MAG TPA: ATP phosphoribosyltransferase [Bacteroidetes bacterium]|mgnify:CR=1 FL=1|nr:MAG: ATP phosphoribosyltransferase [Rhodothermaceae bacterium TMED105]HBD42761.1 ATP phosphoribosyltransferase [Bacteroidota bacterium]